MSEVGRGRTLEECMMSVWKSEEAGADIGNRIGRFISNDEWKTMTKQAKYLRVRVEVPIDKPLRRGGFVTSLEGDKASFGGKMMGVHGFEGYGSGEPKSKEMDHGGKRDITIEDNALIT
ncbi:hypothetical protein FCV25MIE_22169, partial [Fagus crenata]